MKSTFTTSSLRYYAKPRRQLGNNLFFFIYSLPDRAPHLSSWALMFFHSDSAVHLLLFNHLSLFWHRPKWHIRIHYTEHLTSKHFQELFQDCQVLTGESSHSHTALWWELPVSILCQNHLYLDTYCYIDVSFQSSWGWKFALPMGSEWKQMKCTIHLFKIVC